LEGAAFFCLIAWIVDVSYWSLVGAGVCLFLLALKFPREGWHLNEIQRRLKDRS